MASPEDQRQMTKSNHFNDVSESYHKTLNNQLEALKEMDEAKDTMEATSMHVELETISKAGGDPKKLGPTEADRKRAYDSAKASSKRYQAARSHYYSARNGYRYYQGMVRMLDLKMQFMIAVTKAG